MSEEIESKRDLGEEFYRPPAEKSITEILSADSHDESLTLYKQKLLGCATNNVIIIDENNPSRVIVKQIALVVEGRDDMIIDFQNDKIENIKDRTFAIKEGIKYRIRIDFYVQREIVTGLKYIQKITRKSIPCESIAQMIGSFPPRLEPHQFLSPIEEMPSGLLCRDKYKVKSIFTDDDKNEYLKIEWCFEVKKDW